MAKRRSNELNIEELTKIQSVLPTGNLTISEAVELFIEDCEVRNLREHTIKYYRNEFNAFMGLLSKQGVELNVGVITALVITNNVIKAMLSANIKPVSINTRLTALKALFNWLHKKRYIKRNPMEEVSKLRERKEVIETLTVKQIEELLNACNLRTVTGVRDYTILLLFIETGVRVSCHTLRHTFAKLCVINGANAFQLMSILGHTTLEMTKVYVNLFSSEVAEGHKRFSPLNCLKRR